MPETKEILVENWKRSKKFGWGWSCTPTGDGPYSIETPTHPDVTGTIAQIQEHIRDDRAFNSLGGVFYNTAFFYDGQRITHSYDYVLLNCAPDLPMDEDATQEGYRSWKEANDRHHWREDEWGYDWVDGFDPGNYQDENNVKIMVIEEVTD